MSTAFVHLKQLESYLRFPATASACAEWSSTLVTHESALRLNLCVPKVCAEEMCLTCVSIIMLQLGQSFFSPNTGWKAI